MKNIIQSVKGTREFYPREMAIRSWLYEKIRYVSEIFGYQEYDGPFLETIELYAAKSGDELVKEQSFVFPDRGGNLIALRPELTPSLARMVAQRQNQLVYPLRWWSFGPFWRYENPQKGRSREFFQWNIDIIGVNTAEADAELVAICAEFFRQINLSPEEVKILVNDRQLMDQEIARLGIGSERKQVVFRVIDRREKMEMKVWEEFVLEEGFSRNELGGLKELIEDKSLFERSAYLKRFFTILEALDADEYVEYDPRIVRGLDYYTGVVFEAKDIGEENRSILGGGHYDNLVEDVGGNPLPGVGFAMGDVVLPIVLEELGKLPEFELYPAEVLVTLFDEDLIEESFKVADELRGSGIRTEVYPEAVKLGKQFKYADRTDLHYVVVIGPEELSAGEVQIKDMRSGKQTAIKREQAAGFLKNELALH